MTDNKIHPMRIVARRTGLSSHVIRAWERRHNAIEPARTPTNRRLYSDNDIERLQKLHPKEMNSPCNLVIDRVLIILPIKVPKDSIW